MGVNTNAYLPATVDLGQLALVIQKLTDADEVKLRPVGDVYGDGTITVKSGSDYVSSPWFDLTITRDEGFGDGSTGHSGGIHIGSHHRAYGDGEPEDGRLLAFGINVHGGNASAFWCALGDALAKFFGGVVDYNDCDSEYANSTFRATPHAKVTDGDGRWTRTQKAINALTTVTDETGLAKYDETVGIYNRKGEYREVRYQDRETGKVTVYAA